MFFYSDQFILIKEVVSSNGTMLSMSDKYDLVNKRTQETSKSWVHLLTESYLSDTDNQN